MAISAYVGLPGSGKSYEVVASVIIPACISGRRIVSNIYGLSAERIYDYCVEVKKANREALGDIILVENDDVQDKDFFPYKTDAGIADTTRCRPGDLICIDEAWRIWESDRAIPANHRSFVAEHRHFTDAASGICCDLVVINQSVTNLPRFIKDRIETTYRRQKLLALGLKSRYRVDVFTGIKLFKSHRASSYQCGYDKAIFPLYRSYEAGNGKELTIDKRQNVLASSRLWWTVAGLLLLAGVSVSFLVRFFTHVQGPDSQVTSPASSNAAVTMSPSVAVAVPPKPVMSSSWRVAGRLAKAGQVWGLLADNNGRLRAEPVSLFTFNGVMMTGVILQVTPQILADVVELTIDQQLSDFVKTDTGVNNSPTLTKRQVKTQVAVSDGDIILLGGLAESKLSSANTGLSFLPKGWLTGASDEQNKTDLLVVLQVSKVRR